MELSKFHRDTLDGLRRECSYDDTRPNGYPGSFIARGRFPSGMKTISQLLEYGMIVEGEIVPGGGKGYRITEAGLAALAEPIPPKPPRKAPNLMPAPSRLGVAKTRWDK
ncbi:hypothetical protein [Pseudogemmobacter bohemicus]|uniref:hypothetical protein n=1 Tax=Pseudogemmobacter bohemicus TaxID=2250708 RepID=UPI000DD4DA37|nr:hypothetical protein [Pseudogemmobacter bohemicus]